FLQKYQQMSPNNRVGRWSTGGQDFAYAVIPPSETQRYVQYAIAVRTQGRVLPLEARGPVLSDPAAMPMALRHVLESLYFPEPAQ
ncbi:MAG: hypothetical protein KDA85_11545, partial [Planctomycetaceae bacterium]|nr:hypothetical protein [Planctomycetaceae bacterium]